MSGFIAQALLGATGGAATGMGNKLREEAKLKRQQTLDDSRTQNELTVQAKGSELRKGEDAGRSALNIGEQNLQNEYASGESVKNREHELALADKRHGQDKDMADYRLTTELTLARENAKASGKLSDWQNANLDRINGSVDNLQKMERDLMTGKTDGMEISLGLEAEDSGSMDNGEKLAVIRQRLKAEEIKFNRVLGNQKGVDSGMAVLSEAANITGGEAKTEFLTAFRASNSYSEDLERQVDQVWGSKDTPSQQVTAPGSAPSPAPQETPGGGIIAQARATETPTPAPAKPAMPDTVDMSPSNNSAQTLQQKIIERSRQQGQENQAADVKRGVTEVQNFLVSDRSMKMDKNDRAAFLINYGEYFKSMTDDAKAQLKAVFGDDAINRYL